MATQPVFDALPAFDPKSHCVKCGHSIADPEVPTKAGPDGKLVPTGPAPAPEPPTVTYCNGMECPWDEEGQGVDEHMHQVCDVCSYEWVSRPLA